VLASRMQDYLFILFKKLAEINGWYSHPVRKIAGVLNGLSARKFLTM
jgi:hypothetical protein